MKVTVLISSSKAIKIASLSRNPPTSFTLLLDHLWMYEHMCLMMRSHVHLSIIISLFLCKPLNKTAIKGNHCDILVFYDSICLQYHCLNYSIEIGNIIYYL